MSGPSDPPIVVSGLSKDSVVVGPVSVPVPRAEAAVVLADLVDCTVFVTLAARSLVLRNLRRCTIAAAPCAVSVTLEGCAECTISAAAPSVLVSDVSSSLLFLAARSPVALLGASRDVRLAPYNCVGDGVVTASTLREWVAAGTACVRLDARTEAAAARAISPADFYWRFLPVSQRVSDRLSLPPAFALNDAPHLPPAAEAVLAGARGPRAQRAELLTQSKFVAWMLATSTAPGLKNVYREQPGAPTG